jgi:HlyD family secretion protein
MLALVLGAGGGGVWYWQSGHEPVIEYQTTPVARGDLTQVVTATGQLDPVVNVQVGSQISGRIEKLYVDFNSVVTGILTTDTAVSRPPPNPFSGAGRRF